MFSPSRIAARRVRTIATLRGCRGSGGGPGRRHRVSRNGRRCAGRPSREGTNVRSRCSSCQEQDGAAGDGCGYRNHAEIERQAPGLVAFNAGASPGSSFTRSIRFTRHGDPMPGIPKNNGTGLIRARRLISGSRPQSPHESNNRRLQDFSCAGSSYSPVRPHLKTCCAARSRPAPAEPQTRALWGQPREDLGGQPHQECQ